MLGPATARQNLTAPWHATSPCKLVCEEQHIHFHIQTYTHTLSYTLRHIHTHTLLHSHSYSVIRTNRCEWRSLMRWWDPQERATSFLLRKKIQTRSIGISMCFSNVSVPTTTVIWFATCVKICGNAWTRNHQNLCKPRCLTGWSLV